MSNPLQSQSLSPWNAYPDDYRAAEVTRLLAAVRAGECAAVLGLSGAGKSNLMGFLAHRAPADAPHLCWIDGNRLVDVSAKGLLHLLAESLLPEDAAPPQTWRDLMRALVPRMAAAPHGLCLLIDRFDALGAAASPLRALRDAFKYQLTFIIATRRPPEEHSEIAELFYANSLWLGPLSESNALWSAAQYAARRGVAWDAATLAGLYRVSWGYPSFLRGACEACAQGIPPEDARLFGHSAIQRRLDEFWADAPSAEQLRLSGLAGHPWLTSPQRPIADLTAKEQALLTYLQAHAGQICEKQAIIAAVWQEDKAYIEGIRDDSLAQLIRRLRTKIEPDPSNPIYLHTVAGRGYRWEQTT
ncbi:MAG: hypothetical protein OHK0052_10610 [Anaerolineales bacterium]